MTFRNAKTTLVTTSIALSALAFASIMMIPAHAHDSNSSILNTDPFGRSDSETIWYDMNSLDDVSLDGEEDNSEGIKLTAEVPRHTIDTTDFDPTETTSNNWPTNSRVDAKHMSNANTYGVTQTVESGNYFYKIIWLNTNNSLNYNSDGECNVFQGIIGLDNILTYEFGHLAGLGHHSSWPFGNSHTAMKGGCNAGQLDLKHEDINDINDYYYQ